MKFVLMSDLHLEFEDQKPVDFPDADVLVLAGDICVADDLKRYTREDVVLPHESRRGVSAQRYRDFLDRASQTYKHVIYVAGNHEFYHGKFRETLDVLRAECELNYGNVHFLENDYRDIDGVRFLGGTLWTNCNNHDPVTMQCLQYGMNDYSTVVNDERGYTKLRPVHTMERHAATMQYIRNHITARTVVVSHHAPSFQSISATYLREKELNGGYASDLTETILDYPGIRYWCHGHMHSPFDYPIGSTQVVCNPRGYPGQLPDWQPKVFEV